MRVGDYLEKIFHIDAEAAYGIMVAVVEAKNRRRSRPSREVWEALQTRLVEILRPMCDTEGEPTDEHFACFAVQLMGELRPASPRTIAALEDLLDAENRAPECMQNFAVRALGDIGTARARAALARIERRARKWVKAHPNRKRPRTVLRIARECLRKRR